MNIDIKRLEHNAEYWDEVKGAIGGTHYDKETGFFCDESGYYSEHGFKPWIRINPVRDQPDRFIPRPTKPSAPEWDGEGIPPVGCECELSHATLVCFEDREVVCDVPEGTRVKVNGRANFGHGEVAVFSGECDGAWFFGFHKEMAFRPIRTKEQRERDELVSAIKSDLDALSLSESDHLANCLAIGLINRGYRKEQAA